MVACEVEVVFLQKSVLDGAGSKQSYDFGVNCPSEAFVACSFKTCTFADLQVIFFDLDLLSGEILAQKSNLYFMLKGLDLSEEGGGAFDD